MLRLPPSLSLIRARSGRHARGSAMLMALLMCALVLTAVTGAMVYASNSRVRAVAISRKANRLSCVQAGMQLARSYFGHNVGSWNTYLSNPNIYNPVADSRFNLTPANPQNLTLQNGHPELFSDLDGDGKPDVYIYVRDNEDELPPNANDFTRDNDQNVLVGTLCISSTLAPRLENGKVDPAQLQVEGLLSYNANTTPCTQANNGDGSGNCN